MNENNVVRVDFDWLETDWTKQDLDEAERKSEYHRCLYLSHLLTTLKRKVQNQTKVLKTLGAKT